jgi:hypothetical protein
MGICDERGSDRGIVKELSWKGRDEAIDMDRERGEMGPRYGLEANI